MSDVLLRLGALVVLVVVGVVLAAYERRAQRERAFTELLDDMTAQVAELGRILGEQLTPVFRKAAQAFTDLGEALMKGGTTKWK